MSTRSEPTNTHAPRAQTFSGPYAATDGATRALSYNGNRVSTPVADLSSLSFEAAMRDDRLIRLTTDPAFMHLHLIDNAVFFEAVRFFRERGAHWCNLPLTTVMISSPGEIYAGATLNYTSDSLPIDVKWFDHSRRIFLSESSQFYLELRLLVDGVDEVFSIYNSFRKEPADISHLSEFQHIEYEGHIDLTETMQIAEGLVRSIVTSVATEVPESLSYFIGVSEIEVLLESVQPAHFEVLTFKSALRLLRESTGDSRYDDFSLRHFGAWEEVKLTEIVGRHVWLTDFPLLQIPFYHKQAEREVDGVPVAENADLILHGYREVVGAGVRIQSPAALAEKARIFNLPLDDYEPYLRTRDLAQYRASAGFGMGWQRLSHWMLRLPAIWEASHVPRGHMVPHP